MILAWISGMPMGPEFHDRSDAGRRLAERLTSHASDPDLLVLALPRGGVPVAVEVANALHAPLDVFVVRKLGVPGHAELALGAIASGGVRVINEDVVGSLGIPDDEVDRIARYEAEELERREQLYRGDRPPLDARGRTVILVDDGLATGASMRAAARGIRQHDPKMVIVAVPVAAAATCEEIGRDVNEVVCVVTPEPFLAVGMWYEHFEQTTDAEVRELLDSTRPSSAD